LACRYFDVDVFASRLNFYRDGTDWKVAHSTTRLSLNLPTYLPTYSTDFYRDGTDWKPPLAAPVPVTSYY
jgi:hypothetical protein